MLSLIVYAEGHLANKHESGHSVDYADGFSYSSDLRCDVHITDEAHKLR